MDDTRVEKAIAVDAAGDPVRAAELRQTYSRLLAALDRLPADMRTTVVLVALQGLSQAEAAVVLGCPAGTIAWRMHAARKHLSKALRTLRPKPLPRRVGTADLSAELRRELCEAGLPVPVMP